MYSLIQALGLQVAMKRELAPFVVAFVVAELFFKFHSFALECIAFLITWAISIPSPVVLTIRPRCSVIFGSTSSLRCAFSCRSVPSSSEPIKRL